MRVKITLSYDGSRFYGFQIQNSGVQTVANRLELIFASMGITSRFEASGRTDRGVHATGQVVSLDLPPFWENLSRFQEAFNRKALPHIYAGRVERVRDDFHARYDARKRAYRYLLSPGTPTVFHTPYILYTPPFDARAIASAIRLFEGEHDFVHFAKTGSDVTHYVRTIYRTRFYRHGEYYVMHFEANGFLRAQIRLMVAFMLKIGYGELGEVDLLKQLRGESLLLRTPAAPNGLYLTRIWY